MASPGPAAPEGVRLHVVVEELTRVEVGAVAREEEEPEPVGPLCQPPLDLGGQVHGVPSTMRKTKPGACRRRLRRP
jgi:hypothetical protein